MNYVALGRLATIFAEERDRWLLWAPVLVGTGIAVYFGLPDEPAGWVGPVAMAVSLVLLASVRARPGWVLASLILLSSSVGFGAAQLRTAAVAAPVLRDDLDR
ncbi:MAG: hypothetical protein ACREEE_16415, partial [Dongiaceae bacterium]